MRGVPINVAINELVEKIELYETYPPEHQTQIQINEMKAILKSHRKFKDTAEKYGYKCLINVEDENVYTMTKIR
tara:strand:+ start:1952 stop:2173 length:222 start_codon:yes stop_codon:yes gene_type:complete